MKILLACLLAASASVSLAQSGEVPYSDLEPVAKVAYVCGKPSADHSVLDKAGRFDRTLTYPGVALHFSDDGNFVNATRKGRTMAWAETTYYLTCLRKMKEADQVKSAAASTPQPPPAGARESITGAVIFWCLLGMLLLVAVLYRIGVARLWRNRPERLCLACKSIRQPSRYRNGRWYCPVCNADNPVPLDSPAARESGS